MIVKAVWKLKIEVCITDFYISSACRDPVLGKWLKESF